MSDSRQFIFIIGAARSGTKFLRTCLAASKYIDVVPYDVGFIWRYGNENKLDDELVIDDLRPSISTWIKKTLPMLSSNSEANSQFIVEKSVPNTLRVEYLNEIYPNSKFIHLVRDGRAVIESSIRQWREPISLSYLFRKLKSFPWRNYRYALWYIINHVKRFLFRTPAIWGPRYKGISFDIDMLSVEEICAKQWSRCVDLADDQLDKIDSSRVFRIKFEELVNDNTSILRICDFIGISDSDMVINKFKSDVFRGNNEKSINSLTPEALLAIEKYATNSLIRLGYL